jgi:hypothetical protein
VTSHDINSPDSRTSAPRDDEMTSEANAAGQAGSDSDSDTPDTAAPSRRRNAERHPVMLGFLGALLGALIGGVLSYLGSYQQVKAQLETQASQVLQDQKKEQREKREKVYGEFTEAANEFAVQTNEIITDCKDGKCSPKWDDWYGARADYQVAINHLWVFGSEAAVTKGKQVSSTLPASLWDPKSDELHLQFDSGKFNIAYRGFQSVMCRELPAQPRSGC